MISSKSNIIYDTLYICIYIYQNYNLKYYQRFKFYDFHLKRPQMLRFCLDNYLLRGVLLGTRITT